jgi:hypothetical protein
MNKFLGMRLLGVRLLDFFLLGILVIFLVSAIASVNNIDMASSVNVKFSSNTATLNYCINTRSQVIFEYKAYIKSANSYIVVPQSSNVNAHCDTVVFDATSLNVTGDFFVETELVKGNDRSVSLYTGPSINAKQ